MSLYSEKGAKAGLIYAPGSQVPGIYRNTSIGIPLLFKYKLTPGASPYAALGPEFVFILSHHLELPDLETNFDISDNTKKFVLAFNVLLGYELPLGQWRLLAEVRYNRWLGNFLDRSRGHGQDRIRSSRARRGLYAVKIIEEIAARRSIRDYAPGPVEKEKLERILEAGRLAPTARNQQDWRILIVSEPAAERSPDRPRLPPTSRSSRRRRLFWQPAP